MMMPWEGCRLIEQAKSGKNDWMGLARTEECRNRRPSLAQVGEREEVGELFV
jgi:hypothetical protein